MDSGRENGKSSQRLERTDAAVGNCSDRPSGFKQTHSTSKLIYDYHCIALTMRFNRVQLCSIKIAQDPCSLINSLAKFLEGMLSCKTLILRS